MLEMVAEVQINSNMLITSKYLGKSEKINKQ